MPGGQSKARSRAPNGKPGRPSVLTDEATKRMKVALLNLNTIEDAFTYAGIHPSTGYRWLQKGRAATRGEYRDFYETVEDTKTRAKMLLTNVIVGRARTDWKAALAVLERRDPANWARTQKVELDDKTPGAKKREGVRERVVGALEKIEQRLAAPPVETPR